MIEIEQKFWVEDVAALEAALQSLGAAAGPPEEHADQYFNHPARDFRQTQEALRIRCVDGVAHVTYKGPKRPGAVKARSELEWCLSPGDTDGSRTEQLWTALGFRPVAVVRKQRQTFRGGRLGDQIAVTIDRVEGVGILAEVELVIAGEEEIESARDQVLAVAAQMGLRLAEPQSYLSLSLERQTPQET